MVINEDDTQKHILYCTELTQTIQSDLCPQTVKYDDIFSIHIEKQKKIAYIYNILVTTRNRMMDSERQPAVVPGGHIVGPMHSLNANVI